MRPRTEALIGLGALTVLATVAALVGGSRTPEAESARLARPSTFLTSPGGAKGLLDAIQRLGIEAQRFRERPKELTRFTGRPRQLLAVLDPTARISAPDVMLLVRFNHSADLLLAGDGAERLMRCFGYKIERRFFDSVRVAGLRASAPWVSGALVATNQAVYTDSSRAEDVGRLSCRIPAFRSVTTLLRSTRGPVVIRLERDSGQRVILVSDASLLSNQALRDTDAGPFVLGLLVEQYQHVLFDEYHHGYGASGSLAAATLAWSWRSPWGWAAWQLTAVGVLALLFSAIRFGPAVPGISRARRSTLEHVRALATALSAAHGHDEAIASIVRGLRRRLAPPIMRPHGDWRTWLEQRDRRDASSGDRETLTTLTSLTQPGQPSSSVLRAANAVEDLWQSLQR
jgi:hypothetical protein